jgi:hypothetical protein
LLKMIHSIRLLFICVSALVIFTLLAMFPSRALAQDICRQAAGQKDMEIRNAYGFQIDYYARLAAAAQAKGFDPSNFPQAEPNGTIVPVNLPWLIQALAYQRDMGLQAVFQAFSECARGFAPYQQVLNVGTFFLTAGMSRVIPRAATHIDASRLLSGTPFGGPTALIPQARDQILNGLGIGGDVAKVIRNPICIFGC